MKHYKFEDRSNFIGILLIVLGGLFLVSNFNLIPYEISYYVFNWKGILVAIGAILVATKKNKTPGLIMMGVGLFFMSGTFLEQEYGIRISFRDIFWPVMLIVVGLVLLHKRKIEAKRTTTERPLDYLSDSNIMGGGEVKVQTSQFKGGQVTSIMGGALYDMSGSQLAEGQNTLEVFALFGGFTFVFPSDWEVNMEVTTIFGGMSDMRKYAKKAEGQATRQLKIKGFVMFGGGELKNY